jgi:general secretion pathway protein B
MSYILKALKQSEKNRQKGRVPDISTAPATIRSSFEAPSRRIRPYLPYLLLAAALVVLAAVFLWWNPWQGTEQTHITTAAPVAAAEETAATAPEPAPDADQTPQPELPPVPLAGPARRARVACAASRLRRGAPRCPVAASGACRSVRPTAGPARLAARAAGGGTLAFRRLTCPVAGRGRRRRQVAVLY